VEFEMVWKTGDTVFQAVKTAFLTAGTVAFAVLTGDAMAFACPPKETIQQASLRFLPKQLELLPTCSQERGDFVPP